MILDNRIDLIDPIETSMQASHVRLLATGFSIADPDYSKLLSASASAGLMEGLVYACLTADTTESAAAWTSALLLLSDSPASKNSQNFNSLLNYLYHLYLLPRTIFLLLTAYHLSIASFISLLSRSMPITSSFTFLSKIRKSLELENGTGLSTSPELSGFLPGD